MKTELSNIGLNREIDVCSIRNKLIDLIKENEIIFLEKPGLIKHYTHDLELIPEINFLKGKIYPVPISLEEKVAQELVNMENNGIIEKAYTSYLNPLVAVKKKNGQIRLCLDARELNKCLIPQHENPPCLEYVFFEMPECQILVNLRFEKFILADPIK